MPDDNGRMTADVFREALAILGETQSSFADLLVLLGDTGTNKARLVQRWAAGQQDIPGTITALLQLLVLMHDEVGITPANVRKWATEAVEEDVAGA